MAVVLRTSLVAGLLLGLLFGAANLAVTWMSPLNDDDAGALLVFYGPMFLSWLILSYRAARRSGRLLGGVVAGVVVAFTTFCVYDGLVLVRVNVFLHELTGRADWQNLMARFRDGGSESLRTFVNLDYLKGLPFKTVVASAIGGILGLIGGSLSWLNTGSATAAAPSASGR